MVVRHATPNRVLLQANFQVKQCHLFWNDTHLQLKLDLDHAQHPKGVLALCYTTTSLHLSKPVQHSIPFVFGRDRIAIDYDVKYARLGRRATYYEVKVTHGPKRRVVRFRTCDGDQLLAWKAMLARVLPATDLRPSQLPSLIHVNAAAPTDAIEATTTSTWTSPTAKATSDTDDHETQEEVSISDLDDRDYDAEVDISRVSTTRSSKTIRSLPASPTTSEPSCHDHGHDDDKADNDNNHPTSDVDQVLVIRSRLLPDVLETPPHVGRSLFWTHAMASRLRRRLFTAHYWTPTTSISLPALQKVLDVTISKAPPSANAQFYSLLECLYHARIQTLDKEGLGVQAAKWLRRGIHHAAMLNFASEYADGSSAHMDEFHRAQLDPLPSVATQQELLCTYFARLVTTPSEPHYPGDVVCGGIESLKQACKLLGRRIYCVRQAPGQGKHCTFALYDPPMTATLGTTRDELSTATVEGGEMAMHDWVKAMALDPHLDEMPPMVVLTQGTQFSSLLFTDVI